MSQTSSCSDRREFLRRLGRNAAAAAVAAMTALLLMRNGKAETSPCRRRGQCRGCDLADTCSMPAAKAERRRTAREAGDD